MRITAAEVRHLARSLVDPGRRGHVTQPDHDAERLSAGRRAQRHTASAHGEPGIVDEHGARARDDRVARGAQGVHVGPRLLARDPLARAVGRALRPSRVAANFHVTSGLPERDGPCPPLVERGGLVGEYAGHHLRPRPRAGRQRLRPLVVGSSCP